MSLIDTSTTAGQKQWARLCQHAFEDVDAILTWCLPEYERITADQR